MQSLSNIYRKSDFIAKDLRQAIVNGTYSSGEKLPTRLDLVAKYKVSKATIHQALSQLAQEDFVKAVVGRGTIVSPKSPHITKYALLFPKSKALTIQNQFWLSFIKEAEKFSKTHIIEPHFGFDDHSGIEKYQTLLESIKKHSVAGLIFTYPPFNQKNTPLLEESKIPRTALMRPSKEFNFPTVGLDINQLIKKMAKHIKQKKCQRVALILSDHYTIDEADQLGSTFKSHGIDIKSEWIHAISNVRPEWGAPLTRLLMSTNKSQRPDGLILMDDNFLPTISQALHDLNLSVPKDLELISHCNFPWPTHSAVPVKRMGYCIKECLQAMMQQIDEQQQGTAVTKNITIGAWDDEEYHSHKIKSKTL